MPKISKFIGIAFAQVQHIVDLGLEWGVKKLQSIPEDENTITNPQIIHQKVLKMGKNGLKFIGQIGVSYYEEYKRLKTKKTGVKKAPAKKTAVKTTAKKATARNK